MSRSSQLFAAVLFASAMSVTGAFADGTTPGPVVSPGPISKPAPAEDARFECKYAGSFGSDKGGAWTLRCRAEGQIDTARPKSSHPVLGDEDDYLKVTCREDGDKDLVFEGRGRQIATRVENDKTEDNLDTWIFGTHPGSPNLWIEDVHYPIRDQERRSSINFNLEGFNYTLQGECEFKSTLPPGLN